MSKFTNSPIRKNILANLLGIGVNLLNQIVLVPIFLTYWGVDLYSDWIIISALTSFFIISDIGINSTIQNRFAIEYTKGNSELCNALIICNLIIVSLIFTIIAILCVAFLSIFNITDVLSISTLSKSKSSLVFIFLLVQMFATMYMGIPNAILRSIHKNYLAVIYDQLAKLAVVIITIISLITEIDIVFMSCLMCIPLLINIIFKFYKANNVFKITLTTQLITRRLLKTTFVQGFGYLSFPVANAILLQGFTLVVNRYFGTESVVLYNTTRTMCNFIKTLLNTVLNSVWPEYSIAYGKKDYKRMKSLYHKAIHLSMLTAALISVGLLIFGPFIYRIWTNGEVTFNYSLMIAFLIVLFVNTFWNTGCVALLSTNNHIKFGLINVSLTICSLIVAIICAHYTHSIVLIVYSSLIIDIVLTIYVHKRVKNLLTSIRSESCLINPDV